MQLGMIGLGRMGASLVFARYGRGNRMALSVFPEDSIFRIDHFLGKEAIMNIFYFRFANSFLDPIWNRNCAASQAIVDKALALDAPIGGHAVP